MDNFPMNRSSPVPPHDISLPNNVDSTTPLPLENPSYNQEDKDDIQNELISNQIAVTGQTFWENKKEAKSPNSAKKKSKSLAAKRTVGKSSKKSVRGGKKIAKTKASRSKSPVKKKAATSTEKKPRKSSEKAEMKDQKTRPITRSMKKNP